MLVPYVDLGAQWEDIEGEALPLIAEILRGGKSIGDPVIETLELSLAHYLGVNHCVSLNSGTDALLFGLTCLGVKRGDEVITVANSFVASVAAIVHVGATPIFVDVGEDHLIDVNQIESAITSRTVAIMPVHLEGKVCDMIKIREIADKYRLAVIEDSAQSFGSARSGFMPGQLSNVACYSFHPLKNLNAVGDGGFIATNDNWLAERVRQIRNHGLLDRDTVSEFGFVSRLDSIQAAILNVRLKRTPQVIDRRRKTAQIYDLGLDKRIIAIPKVSESTFHSYHLYVIEANNRDDLKAHLTSVGIQTKIHYPRLICDQPAFINRFPNMMIDLPNTRTQSQRILSLPIHQHLTNNQIAFVIDSLNGDLTSTC